NGSRIRELDVRRSVRALVRDGHRVLDRSVQRGRRRRILDDDEVDHPRSEVDASVVRGTKPVAILVVAACCDHVHVRGSASTYENGRELTVHARTWRKRERDVEAAVPALVVEIPELVVGDVGNGDVAVRGGVRDSDRVRDLTARLLD